MLVAVVGMGLVVILGLFGRATKHVWQNSESKFADAPGAASGGAGPTPYTGGGAASGRGGAPGGGVASGDVQPTPPVPPKKDPADSTSDPTSADSLGGSPQDPLPDPPQDIATGSH
jgi:hypothetical protein